MSARTFLSQEIRPYKIDVYGLQDNYLGTLQSYNDNFIGQVSEPRITLSTDGSQSFTCSIPKYYIDPTTNQKKINPRWENLENGVLAENTRILKVFVDFEKERKVFPFIVDKIIDKRDKHFSVFKEVQCSGLAFSELGKIGYKLELNQELVELELEKQPDILMNIQYWLDKVFPNKKDQNGKILEWLTPWCYEVKMDWSDYGDADLRESNKIYDDRFVGTWNVDEENKKLIPGEMIQCQEKSRAIDCYNSNKYNITQDIAQAFEVYCSYEYYCHENGTFIREYIDDNGNVWTGRKVTFYNKAIKKESPLYINYQKNLQSISRESDSSELFTKLYVTPSESSIMENGYVTIADTEANPTLDDFILNFDYLYSIGSISEYQMEFVKFYEAEIRKINSHLSYQSPVINSLTIDLNNQKAELSGLDKQISSAEEQLTYYQKLRDNELTNSFIVKNKDNPYSVVFVLDSSEFYKASLRIEGIITESLVGYSDNYNTVLFDSSNCSYIKDISQIDDAKADIFYILLDEYDYPSAIYTMNKLDNAIVYLSLNYSPKNKYEDICNSYQNQIDQNIKKKNSIDKVIAELEEKLASAQSLYNEKLSEKEQLNQKFERILGPALREGYWTPEKYFDPGQKYEKYYNINYGIDFTESLFENEQLSYIEIDKNKIYFPFFNISNSLLNNWENNNLNDLIIHLQRDFEFKVQATTALAAGNYYFLYNNKKYYFSLEKQLVEGDVLLISVIGSSIVLTLNNNPIQLTGSNNGSNITSYFEGNGDSLGDYLLYNNAGFIFSFKKDNEAIIPILLFNNDELLTIYQNYTRIAFSFLEEEGVYSIEGYIKNIPEVIEGTIQPNEQYDIFFPRIFLEENNVNYSSDTLIIELQNNEEEYILEKYYDYSILLREGKTCITLKITDTNHLCKMIDPSFNYHITYRISKANEFLYLDAKQVAKDNSRPKYSYKLSVATIPKEIESIQGYSLNSQNSKQALQYIDLGQLAYINDPMLGARAISGYVSEIVYVLQKPQDDEIEIKNYKTKFEDLFSTITASSEAMKNNQQSYDIAANSFEPNGTISGDVIQTAINNNDFFFNYSSTGIDINPTEGIILTNKKPYTNGIYGQVVLRGGGIFLSNSVDSAGNRVWNTGITPQGINANLLTAGQINTENIRLYAGDNMSFQWNSEGIYAYQDPNIYVKYSQNGLHLVNNTLQNWDDEDKTYNENSLVSLDWNGLRLKNNYGKDTFFADKNGNLTLRGTLKSYDYHEGESRLLSTGWKIEAGGYAEFNDLFVRGTISASVFEYEETSAVGGRLLVSPTFILKGEHTNQAQIEVGTDNPLIITVPIGVLIEDNEFSAGGRTWKINDVIIFNGKFINKDALEVIKQGKDVSKYPIYEIKQLQMKITELDAEKQAITLTSIALVDGMTQNLFYGPDGNIADTNEAIQALGGLANATGTGDWHLISFGIDGAKEGILLTAIEPNSGSYIDILGKGTDDLTGSTRVRLGDLTALSMNQELIEALGTTPTGWGLFADNAYLRGAIYATSGRIGSLSIDEVEEIPEAIGGVSDTINEITTTKNGKVIINKGAITADSIEAGLITTNHLASEVGEKLVLSSNESIQLIVGDVQSDYNSKFEATNNMISSEVEELNEEITNTKTLVTQTASEIRAEVSNEIGQVNSTITQTASEIRTEISNEIEGVNSKITQTADSFSSEINRVEKENDEAIAETKTLIQQTEEGISLKVSTLDTKLTDNYYTKTEMESKIETLEDSILLEVKETYVDQSGLDEKLGDYFTKQETSTAIELSGEGILQTVSNTYTTKNDLNNTLNEYYTITEADVAIKTSSDGILQTVSNTYATIDSLGNYATMEWARTSINQSASSITAKVESGDITSGKVKTSKVTIDTNGISLDTGGTFTVNSGNFNIDASGNVSLTGKITAEEGEIGGWTIGTDRLYAGNDTNNNYVALSTAGGANDYTIWAGNSDPEKASFAVKRNGSVYLNSVYVQTGQNEDGTKTYATKSLSDYPLWAIWPAYNGAIKSYDSSTGTITTYGGSTINFKKAVSVGTDGGGLVFPIDSNGQQYGDNEVSVSAATESGEIMEWTNVKTVGVKFNIMLGGTTLLRENDFVIVDASSIYDAGSEAVTIRSIDGTIEGTGDDSKVNVTAIASNGKSDSKEISVGGVYRAGYTDALPISLSQVSYDNKNYQINVTRLDGTVRGPFDFSGEDAYNAGMLAGEGKFTAGTYYKGNGATVYARGASVIPRACILYDRPSSDATMVTVWDVGDNAILYKGDGGRYISRGESVTAYTKKEEAES